VSVDRIEAWLGSLTVRARSDVSPATRCCVRGRCVTGQIEGCGAGESAAHLEVNLQEKSQ